MSTDKPITLRGEILPATTGRPLPVVHGPGPGAAIFARARYAAARSKMEAFTAYLRSAKDAVDAMEVLDRAYERRELGLVRAENLDDLRQIERLKIKNELQALEDASESLRLTQRRVLASLEAEALEAEDRLRRLKAPAQVAEKDDRTPAQRAAETIRVLRAEQALIIKELTQGAGGTLSEADEQTIHRMELALQDRINRIIEELCEQ